jgi:N-acetylglucosamine-6-phosphate deacetylase
MTRLLVRGGCDAKGSSVEVAIADGRIAATPELSEYDDVFDASGLTVLPGLLDLQVNGAVGIDITAEPERLWEVAAALPAYGVTAFLPTVITSAADARDRALATLRSGRPAGWAGAEPLGLHFEGPMIAAERKGAHPERWLRPPSLDLVEGWSRAEGVRMVTVAPELPGALDVIASLVARGVVVSIGHTAAAAADVQAAIRAGATLITHLGNAMPGVTAHEPGPMGVALAGPDLVAGVIADGHHLHPTTLALVWRNLGPDRFLAVSDCTAALGLPDGATHLGEHDVHVADGSVRLADGTLAGSAASLPQCLSHLMAATGCSLADAVTAATATAARVVGESSLGSLTPGHRGDLTLVDSDLRVVATIVGGLIVHQGGP